MGDYTRQVKNILIRYGNHLTPNPPFDRPPIF